ncbi:CD48 antigen-like [Dendrobates tinctorius]|uniref:CD48 antigen-like n=1 Tax=Dendrobates tinctorius TaxID=92724 RepID=UPI003CC997D6
MLGRIIQTLCILLAAILTILEGKPDVPLTVHEITDRSVDLILQINGTGAVKEIYWNFQYFILAHFHNNQVDIKNPKFDNRLEILENGSILRINNLRQEDSGIYHVTVQYTDRNRDSASFILTVYDPVPSPAIKEKCHINTTDQCNITLHCSILSNSSDVSYTWKSRHQDSTYQLYSNGSTIQISVPPDQLYTEFLCIVQNLADQKNVSIDVRHICPHCVILKQSKSGKKEVIYISAIPKDLKTIMIISLTQNPIMHVKTGNSMAVVEHSKCDS